MIVTEMNGESDKKGEVWDCIVNNTASQGWMDYQPGIKGQKCGVIHLGDSFLLFLASIVMYDPRTPTPVIT